MDRAGHEASDTCPPPSVWSVSGALSAERGQVGDLVFFEELGFLNGAVVVAGVEAAAELGRDD
jgi:hypothetical protein